MSEIKKTVKKLVSIVPPRNRRAASPAISMVIITAVTITLVLISTNYANQTLERQRAVSEFTTVKESIVAFDDAVRAVAFGTDAARSVRFSLAYGAMQLIPSNRSYTISADGCPGASYTTDSGIIQYSMPTSLMTLGNNYQNYFLGNSSLAVSSTAQTVGQAKTTQVTGSVNMLLSYRVRAMLEGPSILVGSQSVNYVDISLIRLNITRTVMQHTDFDLVARNAAIHTTTSQIYSITGNTVTISVECDGVHEDVVIPLPSSGQVVFNFIVSDVKVSP